jgi:hypothetical protein
VGWAAGAVVGSLSLLTAKINPMLTAVKMREVPPAEIIGIG